MDDERITLREGLLLNREPLSKEALDDIASLPVEELSESVVECLEGIKDKARIIVGAGLQTSLHFPSLSAYEILCISEARGRETRQAWQFAIAYLAAALGSEDAHELLPDDHDEAARIKYFSNFESRSWRLLSGGA